MGEETLRPSDLGCFRTPVSVALLVGALSGGVELIPALMNWSFYFNLREFFLCTWIGVFLQYSAAAISERHEPLAFSALGRSFLLTAFYYGAMYLVFAVFGWANTQLSYLVWMTLIAHTIVAIFARRLALLYKVNIGWRCAAIAQLALIPYDAASIWTNLMYGETMPADAYAIYFMLFWISKILMSVLPAVLIENELKSQRSSAAPAAAPATSDANNAMR